MKQNKESIRKAAQELANKYEIQVYVSPFKLWDDSLFHLEQDEECRELSEALQNLNDEIDLNDIKMELENFPPQQL